MRPGVVGVTVVLLNCDIWTRCRVGRRLIEFITRIALRRQRCKPISRLLLFDRCRCKQHKKLNLHEILFTHQLKSNVYASLYSSCNLLPHPYQIITNLKQDRINHGFCHVSCHFVIVSQQKSGNVSFVFVVFHLLIKACMKCCILFKQLIIKLLHHKNVDISETINSRDVFLYRERTEKWLYRSEKYVHVDTKNI